MYKAIIAIGILAAACLVAGCGSSSDETAEAAVTKAQFIRQADTICSKTRNDVQDAAAAWEENTGKKLHFESAFRQIIGPALMQEAEELRSLTTPGRDEAKLTRMIGKLSEIAKAMATGPNASAASNVKAFQREAKAYGLETCGV